MKLIITYTSKLYGFVIVPSPEDILTFDFRVTTGRAARMPLLA